MLARQLASVSDDKSVVPSRIGLRHKLTRTRFGEGGMGRRNYMRLRHALTVTLALIAAGFLIAYGRSDEISPFGIIILICGVALYLERCGNCRWPIWLGRGVAGVFFARLIGPFYLPNRCAHCGSPDFESPPEEAYGG